MSAFPGVGDNFGKYEILRRIGRGGMGSVFEARQLDLGRAVALKVLSPEFAEDPDFRARFVREASTLAALDSPHVIQVFDSGEHDGELFIATQLIHGRDLLQVLRDEGPLSPVDALQVVGQVASALADAHDAGVLHRDVKPGNVLLRESTSDVFAYLCDFGIARHADATHTRTTGVIGTLSYLAPECHEGANASVASDIYSLGCVLWATLTGHAPFERTSEYQIALAHVREDVPVYVGDSPAHGEINAILQRAMAKDPAARYRSAGDLHVALAAAEANARGLQGDPNDLTRVRDPAVAVDPTRLKSLPPVAAAAASESVRGSAGGASRGGNAPGGTRRLGTIAAVVAAVVLVLAIGGFAAAKLIGPDKASATQSTQAKPGSRADLRSVFASLDSVCKADDPNATNDEAAAFDCNYGAYFIRYCLWESADAANEYFSDNYGPGHGTQSQWFVKGTESGLMWSAYADKKDGKLPYVWAAAYRDHPYTVTVKATDTASREAARTRIDAVTVDRLDAD